MTLKKLVRLNVNKTSRLQFVHIPATGEVWIYHVRRIGWFKKKEMLFKLKPEDENRIFYNFENGTPDSVWDAIQNQREILAEAGI